MALRNLQDIGLTPHADNLHGFVLEEESRKESHRQHFTKANPSRPGTQALTSVGSMS